MSNTEREKNSVSQVALFQIAQELESAASELDATCLEMADYNVRELECEVKTLIRRTKECRRYVANVSHQWRLYKIDNFPHDLTDRNSS